MSLDDGARPAARLTVLTGPSGSGRGGVVALVRARFPSVWLPVPATTRPRRPGEPADARVFVSRPVFERMVGAGELVEWGAYGDHLYGTPWAPIAGRLRAGQPVLLCLDAEGAAQVRARAPHARVVRLGPRPDTAPGPEPDTDVVLASDLPERAVADLVGLLGSSFLTPAQPRVSTARDVG
ncbi:guanylate kinase [Micromonospora echinofusca]|uniref:Guanylate kinase n=1 Tax=Micromonospora echinofusca TaxID=47858 RepID=A0ABS3VMA2_MICEH|nr:guanylate kinase [Micromonospora echinofusca]MBO4205603.1 guanylate kinase [Micromonospora echinofusca]